MPINTIYGQRTLLLEYAIYRHKQISSSQSFKSQQTSVADTFTDIHNSTKGLFILNTDVSPSVSVYFHGHKSHWERRILHEGG